MKQTACLFLILLTALISCNDNDEIPLLSERVFQLNSGEHFLRIGVKAGPDWRAEGDTTWCKMEEVREVGADTLLIHVWINLTADAREVSWKVSNGKDTEEIQIRQAGATSEYHYKIPTVFHILNYRSLSTDKKLEDRLLYMLEKANEFYAGQNRRKIDVNLEFVPATTTPQGQTLERPGIFWEGHVNYKEMNDLEFINNGYGDVERMWDPNKYVSIYIFDFFFSTGIARTALPWTPENNAIEGLLADDRYYYELTDDFIPCVTMDKRHIYDEREIPKAILDLGVLVLNHELGHYFGLLHPFSSGEEVESDYCDDTPDYDRGARLRWLHKLYRPTWVDEVVRVDRDSSIYISTNVEDSLDGYMDEITPDQRKRMRHVLNYSPMIPGPKIPVKLNLKSKSSKTQPRVSTE